MKNILCNNRILSVITGAGLIGLAVFDDALKLSRRV